MYLLYVDESGDTGMDLTRGASRYFGLSGLVLHELVWHDTLNEIIAFRKHLRAAYGLKLREEIHVKEFLHKPGPLARIPKSLRLRMLRDTLDFLETLQGVSLIHVLIDKQGKPADFDVFDKAWMAIFQRFHNTISHRNFPGPRNPKDHGMIITDRTEEPKMRLLSRKLRRYNPVPHLGGTGSRQIPLMTLLEDAIHRDSLHSYFVQLVDVSAYFLIQREKPNKYIQRKGASKWFDRMDAVLCKVASKTDPKGVVRW